MYRERDLNGRFARIDEQELIPHLNVWIEPEKLGSLMEHARRDNLSAAWYIRNAIRKYSVRELQEGLSAFRAAKADTDKCTKPARPTAPFMAHFGCRITSDDVDRLEKLRDALGVSVAEITRLALHMMYGL